jgi:hypothetical protein
VESGPNRLRIVFWHLQDVPEDCWWLQVWQHVWFPRCTGYQPFWGAKGLDLQWHLMAR